MCEFTFNPLNPLTYGFLIQIHDLKDLSYFYAGIIIDSNYVYKHMHYPRKQFFFNNVTLGVIISS